MNLLVHNSQKHSLIDNLDGNPLKHLTATLTYYLFGVQLIRKQIKTLASCGSDLNKYALKSSHLFPLECKRRSHVTLCLLYQNLDASL